jgi:hypothetical protein
MKNVEKWPANNSLNNSETKQQKSLAGARLWETFLHLISLDNLTTFYRGEIFRTS